MKREDLKQIEGMTPEMIDKIMNLHQSDVTAWNGRFDNQQNAINEKVATIDALNNKYKEYDGIDIKKIQKDYVDLQKKYESDMMAKDKAYAKDKLFGSIEWSSNLAKSGAIAQFEQANLKFENGAYVGADEFLSKLKESEPSAFKSAVMTTGFEQKGTMLGSSSSSVEDYFYALNPSLKEK